VLCLKIHPPTSCRAPPQSPTRWGGIGGGTDCLLWVVGGEDLIEGGFKVSPLWAMLF